MARPETSTRRPHPVVRVVPVARAAPGAQAAHRVDPADPVIQADQAVLPVAPADPVVRVTMVPADPAVRATTVPAGRAVPVALATSMAQADRVVLGTTAGPADPAVQTDRAHGTAILSVVTSTERRGAMEPLLGDGAHRRRRHGADRSRRPAGRGWVAQSTTGATRKRPCGIPGSTNLASGSLESGSRSKGPTHTAPALPSGKAGAVARVRVRRLPRQHRNRVCSLKFRVTAEPPPKRFAGV
jgi:hypothetical protein